MKIIQGSLAIALLLVAAIPAQKYAPSPRGLLSVEGKGAASFFGNFSNARHMFLDGELRGKSGIITEVTYRENYSTHSTLEVG